MLFCPLSYSFKIPALVQRVEIDKRSGSISVPPNLAQDADVDSAHELLPENIYAVS